jgi:lysozyme
VLKAHWDPFAKIYDIGYGETMIDGKPITPEMTITQAQAEARLKQRVYRNYYLPLTNCIDGFERKPVSLQASMTSGAYNFGVGSVKSGKGVCGSSAARFARIDRYREACEAQTAFNKAGGRIVNGLVKRREMGDAQRIGEAELCVSGL